MEKVIEDITINQSSPNNLTSSLLNVFDLNKDIQEVMNDVVKEIRRISGCGHVLISRYIAATKTFVPISWGSTIIPTKVSLDKKFMSEIYLDERIVKIEDLSHHNYRLRPDVARLGFMSMIGIPMIGRKGLIGVVECCSNKLSHFCDEMVENLVLLTKQAALIMDQKEHEMRCKLLTIENEFLHEVQGSDKLSLPMLLFRLGETIESLIEPDSIAIFGVEALTEYLHEVMVEGFSNKDIYLLKKLIKNDFGDRMLKACALEDVPICKQSLSTAQDKVLNIIPVGYQFKMQGIIVYYYAHDIWHTDIVDRDQIIKRIIRYTAILLQRNNNFNSIRRISYLDQLTGIGNRRLFDFVFSREFNRFKNSNKPCSLVLIDIDHFKAINDQYGHQAGDAILRQIANMLKTAFGSRSIPARYGGEEFIIVLPNVDIKKALDISDNFRRKIEGTNFATENKYIHITISIGVAAHNGPMGHIFFRTDSFINASDRALYQAKQQGRNRVVAAISK